MFYEAKEFTVKDNLKVVLKSAEVCEAQDLLDHIFKVAASTDYILTSPCDISDDVKKEEEYISKYLDGPNYLLCAYVDNKVVGVCSLDFKRHKKDKHRSSLGIGIQKEYWGKGIGSLLFDELINVAKNKEGIEQIELEVIATNERALALYTKKGFVKVGEMPHEMKLDDGTYLNGQKMVLFLK